MTADWCIPLSNLEEEFKDENKRIENFNIISQKYEEEEEKEKYGLEKKILNELFFNFNFKNDIKENSYIYTEINKLMEINKSQDQDVIRTGN